MRSARPAVALLTGLVLVSCTSASAPPSANPSSSQPSASVPPVSAEPSVIATPQPTPIAGQLPVPGFVTISADALTVRQAPGLEAEPVIDSIACIDIPNPCERLFTMGNDGGYLWGYVFDGPVSADGYEWYLLATEMNTEHHASMLPEAVGWVAAGDGEDAWLVVDERTCPSEPIALAEVTNLALTKLEMLHCLGGEELTLRGWLPALGSSEDPAADLAECRTRGPWLMCGALVDLITPLGAGWRGSPDYLDFVIDPSSDVVLPDRGQWVMVTGSFDHPGADSCGDVAAALICRFSFVLTAIEPG